MPVLIVVPARLESTRLPRKPLQLLAGEPLVVRVAERLRAVPELGELVVATDSREVAAVLAPHGIEAVLTPAGLASGTDRTAAVIEMERYRSHDIVVNVQGDEPFLPMAAIEGAIAQVLQGNPIGTAAAPLPAEHRDDPSRVKVVCDPAGRAIYFSRLAIPAVRDAQDQAAATWWQHLGVYAYRSDTLRRLARMPESRLERLERLEQLRAVEAGIRIGVSLIDQPALPGIDTHEDLARAQMLWADFAEAPS